MSCVHHVTMEKQCELNTIVSVVEKVDRPNNNFNDIHNPLMLQPSVVGRTN